MSMVLGDWLIVLGLLVMLLVGALCTRRYVRSVSAFMAAERCAGRYLISMANAMAGLGVISLVYWFEMYYDAGFPAYWWGSLTDPAVIFLALSGFVIYRFRQTRALTLAQFFEMRYSRNFRVFAGLVAYFSGIVNFGIFPAVGARFFIALCGLPHSFTLLGIEISTFIVLMAGLLSISLVFTFLGGHVAVMVTDFLQGVFANVVFAVVIVFMLMTFRWEHISEVLLQAPKGQSLINPMEVQDQSHFNLWFFIVSVIVVLYGVMGWQGTQGYNCCAKDAHEAKMAGILNNWRYKVLLLIALVTPIAVRTMMHHPEFADQATIVQQSLDSIQADTPEQTETLQTQLRTPYALAVMLPNGLLGLMCAAMLAAFISTHDTYLHSWGSILVQDVILPFREKPLTPRQHLWLLRLSIFGVALFIFVFSILYRPTQYIAMFLAITGAVFVGGAGSAIIGGLYWKRGTTGGAWAAMITGMTLSSTGVIIKQIDESTFIGVQEWAPWLGRIFLFLKNDLTGQDMTFWSILFAIGMYVSVSLLWPGKAFNLDRMLHRGKWADAESRAVAAEDRRKTWLERLGIDREFTGWDRVVALISVGWLVTWSAVILFATIWCLKYDVSDDTWLSFWHKWTWFLLVVSIAVTIWFAIGGLRDLVDLFRLLKTKRIDPTDDGRVDHGGDN